MEFTMNKNLVNTYIKYTVKKPILFFTMIIINLLLIIILALLTKTSVIVTHDGVLNNQTIIINDLIISYTGYIYIYNNRNENVYSIAIYETIYQEEKTIFIFEDNIEFSSLINQKQIKVDIPIREITIFERLFLRGGKTNE